MNADNRGAETTEQGRPPKRSGRRGWMTFGIIVLILVIVGVAGWFWHETPGFCGAICHSPMDPYLKGFESGDESLLITTHAKGSPKLECLDCHIPTLDQQVMEATHWISGDFTDPLAVRKYATKDFCARSGCHDVEKIIAATENYGGKQGFNPHNSRHGEMPCYNCHSMHNKSSLFCDNCHNVQAPKGWVAPTTKGEAIL